MAERPRGTNGAVSRARPSAAPVRRNLFQSQLTRRPTPSSSNSAETVRLEGETSRESTDIVPRDHNGNHILEFPPTLALLDDGDEPPPDEHQELESEIARVKDAL